VQNQDPNGTGWHYNKPIPFFARHAWLGTVNIFLSKDNKVHAFPFGENLDGELTQSLPALIAGWAGQEEGQFEIDYSINPNSFNRLSFSDVVSGSFDPDEIAGKAVLIGGSAIELRDFFLTPKHGIISGHTIQALAAETLIQNRILQEISVIYLFAGLFGLLILLTLLYGQQRFWLTIGTLAAIAVLLEALFVYLQSVALLSLDSAVFHSSIVLFLVFMTLREIDLRRLIIVVLKNENQRMLNVLSTIISDSFDGTLIIDRTGTIKYASKQADELLNSGHSLAEMPIDNVELPDGFELEIAAALKSGQTKVSSNRKPDLVTFRRKKNDEEKFLEYVLTVSELTFQRALFQKPEVETFVCISFRDVTEEHIAKERLKYLAYFDETTGTPNRAQLKDTLHRILKARSEEVAVLSFSLDRFENVVTARGHLFGEELLAAVARRVKTKFPDFDCISHLGGAHYGLICRKFCNQSKLISDAEELIKVVSEPFELDGYGATVGAHAGIAMASPERCDAEGLIAQAQTACQQAVKAKSSAPILYETDFEANVRTRQSLELDLWKALENNELFLVYQPQVRLSDGTPYGAEALVRWEHPTRGLVRPDEFIDIAEQSDLISHVGSWVMRQACMQAARWPHNMKVAVNASASQFLQDDFIGIVDGAIAESRPSADRLEIEITESIFVDKPERVIDRIHRLKNKNISFALDDFGTGYSSFGYIQDLPLDKIKIDQLFIRNSTESDRSHSIVKAIATLAKNFGIKTVAEGIETSAHQVLAQRAGCTVGQGYLYGKPLRAEEFDVWIEKMNYMASSA
ncbi:MAG: EAL domain-containing protein, partial [Pseudomonadota bacterium]